jgi:hypothetical protein
MLFDCVGIISVPYAHSYQQEGWMMCGQVSQIKPICETFPGNVMDSGFFQEA